MGKPILRGLILTLAGLIIFSWASAQAGPRIDIPQPERDLGTVIGGSLITQEFIVSNRGDARLIITKLDNDWGCTVASYTKTIPPGGRGKITLRIHTGGMKGSLSKGVVVYSNDPYGGKTHLNITARVKPPIKVEPTDEPMLRTLTGQQLTVFLKLTNTLAKPLKIKGVHSHLGNLVTTELKETEPGRAWSLKIALKSDQPLTKAAPLELILDSTEVSNFMIYTRVEINN